MTPGEAAGFYEDDEDPADAGPHVVTSRPSYDAGGSLPLAFSAVRNETGSAEQVRHGLDYIRTTYGEAGDAQ